MFCHKQTTSTTTATVNTIYSLQHTLSPAAGIICTISIFVWLYSAHLMNPLVGYGVCHNTVFIQTFAALYRLVLSCCVVAFVVLALSLLFSLYFVLTSLMWFCSGAAT